VIDEYGDPYSAMNWSLGHYAASHKSMLGWLTNSSSIQTVTTSGSFSLQPLETLGSTNALKVRRGTDDTAWLWLEYRTPTGLFDSTLDQRAYTGALIHFEDPTTGIHSHLLDFTLATDDFGDAVLGTAKTWTDPYSNLSISIGAATASALEVTVSYGAIPCAAANPSVTISPLNPSVYAGGNVNYTVSVTNNDSSGCPARLFNLSSQVPGWPTAFSQSGLTLSPGSASSVTMTKSVPTGTGPATYAVAANVATTATTTTANANLTVIPAPPVLSVVVSVPASSYTSGSTIPISSTVKLGASPVSAASVTLTMTNPKGVITTKKATTTTNGVAIWSYKPGPKDPKGTYQVSAKVSYNTQTAASSIPATFTIN
jgi:hypothetical protein